MKPSQYENIINGCLSTLHGNPPAIELTTGGRDILIKCTREQVKKASEDKLLYSNVQARVSLDWTLLELTENTL